MAVDPIYVALIGGAVIVFLGWLMFHDTQVPTPDHEQFCPSCGYAVSPDNQFCLECGAAQTPDKEGSKICTECHTEVDVEAKFCSGCQRPFGG